MESQVGPHKTELYLGAFGEISYTHNKNYSSRHYNNAAIYLDSLWVYDEPRILTAVQYTSEQTKDSIIEVVHDDWFLFIWFIYYSLACDVQYNCIAGARIEETCNEGYHSESLGKCNR